MGAGPLPSPRPTLQAPLVVAYLVFGTFQRKVLFDERATWERREGAWSGHRGPLGGWRRVGRTVRRNRLKGSIRSSPAPSSPAPAPPPRGTSLPLLATLPSTASFLVPGLSCSPWLLSER